MSMDSNLQSAFTAVGNAVKGKISSSEKGQPNGVATLDGTGKIPSGQLPSYVDDVVEYDNLAEFPVTGTAGVLYIDLDTNKQYRWAGSSYQQITSGAVDSVAGKTGVVSLVKSDVGLGSVDNTADSTKNVFSATKFTTARTLTIGSTGKPFDGTTNVSWSLSDIGAQAAGNYQPLDSDLTAISSLVGSSGFLKKTAADTWTLDTNTYVTSSGVTSVSGTAPILSSGGSTPTISMSAATTSSPGYMSALDKTKLDGITAGANINVTTDLSTTYNAGTVVIVSSDGTDATINAATTSLAGVLSSADKTKLDGLNNYSLPNGSSSTLGGVKLYSDVVQTIAANNVTATTSRTYGVQINSTGQAVVNVPWIDTNTTYSDATTSTSGLMSNTDKTKLDGIASGATSNVGTVTSISTSGAITGGTITDSGTISHSTADGFLHVPATGTTNAGKVLTAGSTPGSLSWSTIEANSVTSVAGRTGDVVLNISDISNLQSVLDGKATTATVTTLSNNIGATNTDYLAVFNAALL